MKFSVSLMLMLPLLALGRVPLSKPEEDGEIWAVLVAGTEEWDEYRHQADICHAYQILSANGVPDDHIVVMMFDNIADNIVNPFPGQIFNHPTGDDVYPGVPKDYNGHDVTKENLFKVLRGDAKGLEGIGSGKVINSGPNDRIFISMEGFGDNGIFFFPYEIMMANEFADVVLEMKENNRFKEMMVYMDSSCSATMFQDLYPDDIGFYALSAANADEVTYAAYCVDGPFFNCYGEQFAVSWMEDVDSKDPSTELLKENFEITKELTYLSEVTQWGQISVENENVAAFMGSKRSYVSPARNYSTEEHKASARPSQDVPLINLQNRLRAARTPEEKTHLSSEIRTLKNKRSMIKNVMERIVLKVSGDERLAHDLMTKKQEKITAWNCYGEAANAFHKNCYALGKNTAGTTIVSALLNMCEAGYKADDIVGATKNVCVFPTLQ
ncbi:legumain-like [Palaemon carinicauda]|uniref:legumain-like n=1 Tax=Palaemon carinicauda TaxID=392227 RepID=UPI0035B69494